jgi:protease-4
MKTRKLLAIVALAAACVPCGCGRAGGWIIKPAPVDKTLEETAVKTDAGLFVSDKVLILDLDGLIVNDRGGGMFGPDDNPVSLFIEKLDKAQADASVKAVVLRINSPGGGVTASDIMHRRLKEFIAKRKIPVIAIIEDVGASGGYYVACAAERILAHPTSITGSIGVIVQTVSFAGTMEKLGITARAVKSGAMKDMGSPLKPLDDKDLTVIQGMVDEYYKRFVDVVAAARPGIKREELLKLADGRVYSAQQAKANGLVDDLGYVDDAVAAAKARAGVTRAKVVMYNRPLGYRANFYSAVGLPTQFNLVNISVPGLLDLARPRFLYLWTGPEESPAGRP